MPMKNPVHPGRIVKSASLDPLGLSGLTKIVHGRSGVSPQMAIRLSKAFGSTAETWVRMQASYGLAQARKQAA